MAKLTIRHYRRGDIAYLVEQMVTIIPSLPHYKGIQVSKPRLTYLLEQNMNPQSGFAAWVLTDNEDTPQGGVAAYCAPALFSTDLVANDVFLYIDPAHRSLVNVDLLISTYVQWARSRVAKLIKATETAGEVVVNKKQAAFDKLLARHKFQRIGSMYYVVD